MKIDKTAQFLQKYKHEMIQIDTFSAAKLGLIQSQTVIKVENLQLICSPFQISMQRAILLCVLTERELPFFNSHRDKLAALKFVFSKTNSSQEPVKYLVWTKINQIIPLKGRQDLCMVDLSYKNCPNGLIDILGHFLDIFKVIQNLYIRYKDKDIILSPETSRRLRYNDYIEAKIGEKTIKIRLLSLAVNRLQLLMPIMEPALSKGSTFDLKIYFQQYRIMCRGTVEQLVPVNARICKILYAMKFIPELVDIVDEFYTGTARAGIAAL